MKANLLFTAALFLLVLVACRDEGGAFTDQLLPNNSLSGNQSASTPHMALDSFQRSIVATLPAAARRKQSPKNTYHIIREKDSITISGALYNVAGQREESSYHFYFKASGNNCYAYVMQQYCASTDGRAVAQFKSREVGYHLYLSGSKEV